MVIQFASKKARDFLLANGFVFTFRMAPRKSIGRDWANSGRGTPKFANVYIEDKGELIVKELKNYVDWSGFRSLTEWTEEISRMNGGVFIDVNDKGWLYKVNLLERVQ